MSLIWRKKFMCLRAAKEDIYELDYCHQKLDVIPGGVFIHERTLECLYLDFNHIRLLPRELFLCLKLRKLSISDNEISSLPSVVGTLLRLTHIDVSKNCISEIPEEIKFCRYLQVFNISANPLIKLPEGVSTLENLTELYLNNTFLESLPDMSKLCQLRVLELRENKLSDLPSSFSHLVSLQRLDISNNKFKNWPKSLKFLSKLEELWFSGNPMDMVPGDIGCLANLTFLELSNNLITSLHDNIGNCTHLTDLHLSCNDIRSLPYSLNQLKNLNILKIDNNCLNEVPDFLESFTLLSELDLSGNNLETIPASISFLKNLKILMLNDNFINILPDELCLCCSLTVLLLRSNNLSSLPDDFGLLANLKVLNAVDNRLEYLPYSLINIDSLRAVWLTETQTKPMMRFYPETTKTGLKIVTCHLLPQTSSGCIDLDVNRTTIERLDIRKISRKFVSFTGDAKNNIMHKLVSPTYPKEVRRNVMKSLIKNSDAQSTSKSIDTRKLVHQASLVDLTEKVQLRPTTGQFRKSTSEICLSPSSSAKNYSHRYEVEQNILISEAGYKSSSSDNQLNADNKKANDFLQHAPKKGILRVKGMPLEVSPKKKENEELEQEFDVDEPFESTNSDNDSGVSAMSYEEFLENLSRHGIPIPKRKRGRRNRHGNNSDENQRVSVVEKYSYRREYDPDADPTEENARLLPLKERNLN